MVFVSTYTPDGREGRRRFNTGGDFIRWLFTQRVRRLGMRVRRDIVTGSAVGGSFRVWLAGINQSFMSRESILKWFSEQLSR